MKEGKNRLFGLTGRVYTNKPLIEILGDHRLLIEHHKGVIQYETNLISVKVNFGFVEVRGTELTISCMSRENLVICGKVDSVHLWKGSN